MPDKSAGVDWRRATVARARAFGSMLPILAVAVVVLTAATDFFPDTSLFPRVAVIRVFTPLRLVIIAGVIGLVSSGARLAAFRTRIDLPVAALVLVAAAGIVPRHWPAAPLRELFVEVTVFYLAVGVRRRYSASWAPVSMLALVGVATAGLVAFAQMANQTPTGFCGGGFLGNVACGHGAIIRAEGTFANPNALAAFLLLLAPVATCAVSLVAERLTRAMLIGLAVVGWAAVLTTFSRSAYVAMLVSLALVVGARRLLSQLTRLQLTLLISGGALVLAASGGVVAVLWRHDASLSAHGQAWVAAVHLAVAHPVLGVGLGRAGAVVSASTGEQFAHVHNLWLNWLVETGVPGLLAITAITVIGIVSAARRASQGSVISTAELAGLTGFLLMNLLDDPANLSRIAMAMWLTLGSIMAKTPARWRDAGTPAPRDEEDSLDSDLPEDAAESTHPLPAVPAASGGRNGVRATRKSPQLDPLGETQPIPPYPPRPAPTTTPPPKQPLVPGRPGTHRRAPNPPHPASQQPPKPDPTPRSQERRHDRPIRRR